MAAKCAIALSYLIISAFGFHFSWNELVYIIKDNQRAENPNIVQSMSSTEEKVTDCVKGSLYHVILWAGDIIKIGPA